MEGGEVSEVMSSCSTWLLVLSPPSDTDSSNALEREASS